MGLNGNPDLYRRGAELRGEILGKERLEQALRDEDDLDEYYHLYGHECAYAQVWTRDGLPRLERALFLAGLLASLGPLSETLRVHTRGCVRAGATRAQLRQVLAMVTWYAGVPVGSQATASMRAALQNIPEAQSLPRATNPTAPSEDLATRGRVLREHVLGSASNKNSSEASAFLAHESMQDTHYFGMLWSNEDLTLKQRVMVLLGVICGSNRTADMGMWLSAALRVGCTADELEELLLTAGIYSGELTYAAARKDLLAALASAHPAAPASCA
jgi:4-carboxymuconolactone decarboxylase